MSDNMIERVARAIKEKFAPAIDFNAPYAKVMLDVAARAAIAAMREPSVEILMAAQFSGEMVVGTSITKLWQAMIDAALQEKKG